MTQTLKILSILVVSGAVLIGSVGFFNFWSDRSSPDDEGRPATLTITVDDDGGTVAQKLSDADLVQYGVYFETRLRFSGNELVPGTYTLRKGMSANEIISAVTVSATGDDASGTPPAESATELKITFVEGQRVEEYAETLVAAGWTGDPQAFIDAARTPANPDAWEFLSSLPDGASLEGYLFPDTYTIPSNAPPQDVIDYMLTTFDGRFTGEMRQQAEAEGLTVHEVVTFASIVERESAVPEENATIAALYRNRLEPETLLPLQADPTIQYVVGTAENWWPALNTELIQQAAGHPYNTYNVEGLPPGPIANPGLRSLQAVLDPEDVDYLYMVAKDDGTDTHAFTNDLEEHEENICTYNPDAEICTNANGDAPDTAVAIGDAYVGDRRLNAAA